MQISTSLAMKIAEVSNIKFNEAVSRNYYVPRSSVEIGKPRIFDLVELFGLTVMGSLLKFGLNLPLAASRACSAREVLEGNPLAKEIWINIGKNADSVWVNGAPVSDKPLMSIVFHVEDFRSQIEQEVLKSQVSKS